MSSSLQLNVSLRSSGNGSEPVIRVGCTQWSGGFVACLMAMPLCGLRLSFENPTSKSCGRMLYFFFGMYLHYL